jgi:hypothetical protein
VAWRHLESRRCAVTEFDATAVAFRRDEDVDAEYLVLAENEDGSGERIEIQRSLTITDDDRRLGMDTYCLVNEGGVTHYGGVEAWSLNGSVLEIKLDQDAAQELGAEGGYRIHLADPQKMADEVKVGLRAILGSP